MSSRKERKRNRKLKGKRVSSPTVSKIETLARAIAKIMDNMPKREHANETFIDWNKELGCIPAGTMTKFFYCQTCFYARGCVKDIIQWRLSKTGQLTSYP